MTSRSKDSANPLTTASSLLEAELVRFEQAVKDLDATTITSEKTLQRARRALEQCAEFEPRLGVALRAFAEAMQDVQVRQQRGMEATLEMAKRLEQRFAGRTALLERVKALGERAKAINEPVVATMTAGPEAAGSSPGLLASLESICDLTASLIDEAGHLQKAAKDEEWLDIERDTATLKEQLQAARNKILIVQRNLTSRMPE